MSRLGRGQPFRPVLAWGLTGAAASVVDDIGSVFLSTLDDTTTGTASVFLSATQGNTAGQSVFVDARRDT